MKTLKLSNKTYIQIQRLLWQGGNSALDQAVKKALISIPLTSDFSYNFNIDIESLYGDAIKTQDKSVECLNGLGKAILSMPMLYRAVSMPSQQQALESIRKECKERCIIPDDKVFYKAPDYKGGSIIHNYESSIVKSNEIHISEIPVYDCKNAKRVVEGKGLEYVRALFGTEDKPAVILNTLERLTQLGAESIRFGTPLLSNRKYYPKRKMGFRYYANGFHVDGGDSFFYSDISRGVQYFSRSGHMKK